ncbi:unnamed protein product [Acanthoscelides obtectus]|uniref:Uncharacterized protein n=1 Tax=Acanthoscelides obtectus TaxID=200917 RepID=A0A9P0L2W2_ACAOB|nr:unnamed protein product [Acanthoscelides obtectus]CAK1649707.1 hypothetical protein AOBTE_LOCUS16366 [Acanthoscelides obtectus]
MQKCPLVPFFSSTSTSFLYKLLTAIKQLQQQDRQRCGVCFEDIVRFMKRTCGAELDIGSQVYYTLRKAEQARLVSKTNNVYILTQPAACIHMVPESCVQAKLKELLNIFSSSPGKCTDRGKRKPPACEKLVCGDAKKCKRPPKCGGRSSTAKSRKSARKSARISARGKSKRRSRSKSKSRSRSRSRSKSPCGIRRDFIKQLGIDADSLACSETSDDGC